ncbi:hypothetical protein Q7A53_16495 [Halobacillus rhizosphaerae]
MLISMLAAVVIAFLLLIALLVAILFGSSEQREIVVNCINHILGTV